MTAASMELPGTTSPSAPAVPAPAAARQPAFRIVCAALLVRLVLLLLSHGVHFVESRLKDPTSFVNETTNIAASIAAGHGFGTPFVAVIAGEGYTGPSAWIAPVYPYLCAAFFKAAGSYSRGAFVLLLLLQCVFSALTCIPILRIGELTVGPRAGYIAALLWAVFPWFSVWAISWIWEISLSALLMSLLFWWALRLKDSFRNSQALLFGAAWGFALLVNPALLMLLPVSLLWLTTERRRVGTPWLRSSVLALLACSLVTAPWIVRNRVVVGSWSFIRGNFGFEFALANYHGSKGLSWIGRHPVGNPQEMADYRRLGEARYLRSRSVAGRRFVEEHPREFVTLTARRAAYFWDGEPMRYDPPFAPVWMAWSFLPLSLLCLPSLILCLWRRIPGAAIYAGVLLLYPLPYYAASTMARFRHAVEPLMLLLVAYAAVEAWRALRPSPMAARTD